MPGYQRKMVLFSQLECLICDCVHSYSNSPHQTPFWNVSLTASTKQWTAILLAKTVCTKGPGAHFCVREQGLDLVLGYRHRARIIACKVTWKKCVFALMPSELPYTRASCSGRAPSMNAAINLCLLPVSYLQCRKYFIISYEQREDRKSNCHETNEKPFVWWNQKRHWWSQVIVA